MKLLKRLIVRFLKSILRAMDRWDERRDEKKVSEFANLLVYMIRVGHIKISKDVVSDDDLCEICGEENCGM